MNIELKEDFKQVCVWPNCKVSEGLKLSQKERDEFEELILEKMGVRTQLLEQIVTLPDMKDGRAVLDTGGRCDTIFAVHSEDVGKFAIPRLRMQIRWIEDVLAKCNYNSRIYPDRLFEYCSWNEEYLAKETPDV